MNPSMRKIELVLWIRFNTKRSNSFLSTSGMRWSLHLFVLRAFCIFLEKAWKTYRKQWCIFGMISYYVGNDDVSSMYRGRVLDQGG